MRTVVFILIFLNSTLAGLAQSTSDSLFSLLEKEQDQNEKSILYASLAKSFEHTNKDTAFYFANKGRTLSEELEYELGIAENAAVLGDLYVIDDNLDDAKTNYIIAAEYFHKAGKLYDHTQVSMIIGNIHLAQNRYIEAIKVYQQCVEVAESNEFNVLSAHLYNNLGVLYLNIEDLDEAYDHFEKAHLAFEQFNETYNAANARSNQASILALKGKEDEAIKLHLDVIRLFSEERSWVDIARSYNDISEIYRTNGEFEQAKEYLNLALSTMKNNDGNFSGPASIYKSKIYTNAARIELHFGEFDNAMDLAKLSLELSYSNSYKANIVQNAKLISNLFKINGILDSALYYISIYNSYNEEIQQEDNAKKITQLRMQYEFDDLLQEKELEDLRIESEHRQKELKYMGALVLTVLSVLILILLFINQKNKTTKANLRKENLELERINLNKELEYKNKELATNMMYLLEKNEFITNMAKQLGELKGDVKQSNQGVVQQLITELRQNTSKDVWEEFEVRFKEVHSEFYEALNREFPDLSPNEKRICAFLRLNMSTKEISSITYQTTKSIDQARFRLRKKMGMERDENLISFLAQL